MTTEHMPPHPFAEAFPLLPKAEAEELAADIRANGLIEDIVTLDGMVLDGRNRYAACIAAGVEPRFVEFTGKDALAFVISRNLVRRHLTDSQRAMAAARLANMPLGGAAYRSANLPTDGVSQADAATQLKVSTRSVTSANKVLKSGDEKLIKRIDDGEITVNGAILELDRRERARMNWEQLKQANLACETLTKNHATAEAIVIALDALMAANFGDEYVSVKEKIGEETFLSEMQSAMSDVIAGRPIETLDWLEVGMETFRRAQVKFDEVQAKKQTEACMKEESRQDGYANLNLPDLPEPSPYNVASPFSEDHNPYGDNDNSTAAEMHLTARDLFFFYAKYFAEGFEGGGSDKIALTDQMRDILRKELKILIASAHHALRALDKKNDA